MLENIFIKKQNKKTTTIKCVIFINVNKHIYLWGGGGNQGISLRPPRVKNGFRNKRSQPLKAVLNMERLEVSILKTVLNMGRLSGEEGS